MNDSYLGTKVAPLVQLAKHGAMLLIRDVDERGKERIVVLPFGSIVTYFTSREDAPGITLHVRPGLCAFPAQFEALSEEVRAAVLAEAAHRLLVSPGEVLQQAFLRLVEVTDPELAAHPQFVNRKRSRGRSSPFSR